MPSQDFVVAGRWLAVAGLPYGSCGNGDVANSLYSVARLAYGRHVADRIFAERRLAQVYDPLDPDRSDLSVYVALVDGFGARSVLDIGCGTGTFACLLANRGPAVTAVDPAAASLELARTKPGGDRVRWIHGYATDLPPLNVDLATMTANVAQVFLTDDDSTLRFRARDEVTASLVAAGFVVDEVRDAPDRPGREMVFIARRPDQ